MSDGFLGVPPQILAGVPAWRANTTYQAGQLVISPNGDPVTAKNPFTSTATYDPANWNASAQDGRIGTLEANKWLRTDLALNADLNTILTPGVYGIPTSAIATSLVNGPPLRGVGSISVVKASTSNGVYQQTAIMYHSSGRAMAYSRQSLSGTFTLPWEPVKWTQPTVANGTDWNTVTVVGAYQLDSRTNAGTMLNLPPSTTTFAGTMEVLPVSLTPNARVMQRGTEYAAGAHSGRTWQRMQEVDGTFTPWQIVTAPTGVRADPVKHQILQQRARKRRGGRYGTGGKTLVALRLDDSYTAMIGTVLPLLKARGIPFSVAVTANEWTNPYNTGTTWADLQAAILNGGGEAWNHSNDHTDANTIAALTTTIEGALTTIRANMPKIAVDGFIPPGVGTAGSLYMGFDQGVSDAAFHNTPAGVMLLNNHAFVTGNMESQQPLDGVIKHGTRHVGLDTPSFVTAAENQITAAIGMGVGIVPMIHPYRIDTTDYTTLTRFTAFLDFLVARRDAGEIDLVTIGALMTADAGTSFRHDLARASAWVAGSQTIDLTNQSYVKGGVRELSALGAGSVTLQVTDNTGALNTSVTMTPGSVRARLPFTIPLDAASITCTVTGGTDPKVLAV